MVLKNAFSKKIPIFVFICLLMTSFVSADILQEAEQFQERVNSFIEGNAVIVMGNHASKSEKISLHFLKQKYPDIAAHPEISENEFSMDQYADRTVVFVGGIHQNKHSKIIESEELNIEYDYFSFGVIAYITNNEGRKFMVFSDNAGMYNLMKNSERSPLAKFIPIEYVPLAATAVAFSLLWLWHLLVNIFNKVLKKVAISKIMKKVKKKEFKKDYRGFKLKGVRFKYREWTSIILAALVFALGISYSFFSEEVRLLILTTFLVNILIYAIRHFARLFMDKKHELHTEYVFWFWGAIITVLSGWLGNTFGLAGYNISKDDKKGEAKIQYTIDILTFTASLIFLVWNMLRPSLMIQMAMIFSMTTAVVQMLPFDPFSGKKVKKWSSKIWWLSFIPMVAIYLVVNALA